MDDSASDNPPAKSSSSKRRLLFKKKAVVPAKKRVLSRPYSRILARKTTLPKKSGYKEELKVVEDMDNTITSQQCGSSRHGEEKSPEMVRAIELPSKLKGSSGHGEEKSPEMVRAIELPSKLRGSSGHGEVKSPAMDQAKEIQAKLPREFPSFVKYMCKSNVAGGFFLSLRKSFCDSHLPKKGKHPVLLVDEEGEGKCTTTYLAENHGLSAKWKGFALGHNLVEGDVLVFQLIEPLKFKVYIVRSSQTAEANGAASLLNIHPQAKTLAITHCENEFEDATNVEVTAGEDMCVKDKSVTRRTKALDSEPVAEGSKLAKPILQFEDVRGFDSFSIIVDGLAIETDIPTDMRFKYYTLCIDQKSFLHNDLIKGLNSKLAAGIILQTVTISDAIKPTKHTVSLESLQTWDRILKAFEDLGMKVGFLRASINKLECVLYEQEILRSKKLEQTETCTNSVTTGDKRC